MRKSLVQTVSVFAASTVVGGSIFAYVVSGRYSAAQTLTTKGMITTRTRALVQGDYAYTLGMPEIVSDIAEPDQLSISPDGGAVLIVGVKTKPYRDVSFSDTEAKTKQQSLSPQMTISCWDMRTRATKTLYREMPDSDGNLPVIEEIQWLRQTHSALVTVSRFSEGTVSRTLMRIDGATGTVTRLTGLTPRERVVVSPTDPMAILLTMPERKRDSPPDTLPTVRLYTRQGFRPPVTIQDGADMVDWMPDGKSIYALRLRYEEIDGKKKRRQEYSVINLLTGAITHPERLTDDATPPPDIFRAAKWEVGFMGGKLTQTDPAGDKQTVPAIWLFPGSKPAPAEAPAAPLPSTTTQNASAPDKVFFTDRLLVAANAEARGMMRGSDIMAVLFLREGVLYASPIFRMPTTAYLGMMHEAQRVATMNNAKQIGLAILMYAQDYDETFPVPGNGVSDTINPYLRNNSVFNNPFSGEPGFTYSYNGETNMSKIANPAMTQLGSLAGLGGKAILWGDGHVTWQPEK